MNDVSSVYFSGVISAVLPSILSALLIADDASSVSASPPAKNLFRLSDNVSKSLKTLKMSVFSAAIQESSIFCRELVPISKTPSIGSASSVPFWPFASSITSFLLREN